MDESNNKESSLMIIKMNRRDKDSRRCYRKRSLKQIAVTLSFTKIICLVLLLLLNQFHLTYSFFPVLSTVKQTRKIANVVSPRRNFQALQLRRKRRLRDRQINNNNNNNNNDSSRKKRITPSISDENSVDAMRARAAKLRLSIVKQQLTLQELERQIICCHNTNLEKNPWWMRTFSESTSVLMNKMKMSGLTVGQYAWSRGTTGMRIVSDLVSHPTRLAQLMDPDTPTLVPHVPAIVARLDKLESHVAPILERVLNNRRHLASIEPYLDQILGKENTIIPTNKLIFFFKKRNLSFVFMSLIKYHSKLYLLSLTPIYFVCMCNGYRSI